MKTYLIPVLAIISLITYYFIFVPITTTGSITTVSDYTPANTLSTSANVTSTEQLPDIVPEVEVCGFSIQKMKLDPFEGKGTKIGLWVKTGDKNFVKLLSTSKLNLVEADKKSPSSFIGKGRIFTDTTGFSFKVSFREVPPPRAQELSVTGNIVYTTLSGEPTYLKLELQNIEKLLEGGTATHKGKLITFSKDKLSSRSFGSFSMGGKTTTTYSYNPNITYGDRKALEFSLDGQEYKKYLAIPKKQLTGKTTLYLKFFKTVTKEVAVDKVLDWSLEGV